MRTFSDEATCTDSTCGLWPNPHPCANHADREAAGHIVDDEVEVTYLCGTCLEEARTIHVVPVMPDQTWPCERCDREDVIAYVAVPGEEATTGYCARCLGAAVASEVEEIVVP